MSHNRGLCQTHTAPLTSAPWRAAHVAKRRAVAGAGVIREQVASEQLSNRVGLFSGERVLKIRPPPLLSSHLSSSPMGAFSRAYCRYYHEFITCILSMSLVTPTDGPGREPQSSERNKMLLSACYDSPHWYWSKPEEKRLVQADPSTICEHFCDNVELCKTDFALEMIIVLLWEGDHAFAYKLLKSSSQEYASPNSQPCHLRWASTYIPRDAMLT